MSQKASAPDDAEKGGKGGRRKLLLLLAVPVVLAAIGAGLWFTGILPKLLGMGGEHHAAAEGAAAPPRAPVFFDMPEIVANLNATGRRASYIRLRSKLELSKPEDAAVVQAAMPRLLSRWPKVSYQVPKPEVLRGHPGLAARLLRLQSQHPVRGIAGQSIDRGSLPIGGDKSLQFAPELVHRVQFRSLLGQPEKPDGERCGQHLGARGGVRAGPVGE
jgi:flagellar protein FliL